MRRTFSTHFVFAATVAACVLTGRLVAAPLEDLIARDDRCPKAHLTARFEVWRCRAGQEPFDRAHWFHAPGGDPEFALNITLVRPHFRIDVRGLAVDTRSTTYAWVNREMVSLNRRTDGRVDYIVSAEPAPALLMAYPILTALEIKLFHIPATLAEMAARGWLTVVRETGDEVEFSGKHPDLPSSTVTATLDRPAGLALRSLLVRTEGPEIKPMWGHMRVARYVTIEGALLPAEAVIVTQNPNVDPDYMVYRFSVDAAEPCTQETIDGLRPEVPATAVSFVDYIRGRAKLVDEGGKVVSERSFSQDEAREHDARMREVVVARMQKEGALSSRKSWLAWGLVVAAGISATALGWSYRLRLRHETSGH